MGKSTTKVMLGAAVLYLFSAVPALAADLILKVDSDNHTVAITNTLPSNVYMLYLESLGDANLALNARINAGATVNVPLRFAMPAAVGPAVCDIDNQRRFLSVELR